MTTFGKNSGAVFPPFGRESPPRASPVEPELPTGRSRKLAARELRAIARLENNEVQVAKLRETASDLDPPSMESLGAAAQENLGLPVAAFRATAKQIAHDRKAAKQQQEQQSGADVAQIA